MDIKKGDGVVVLFFVLKNYEGKRYKFFLEQDPAASRAFGTFGLPGGVRICTASLSSTQKKP